MRRNEEAVSVFDVLQQCQALQQEMGDLRTAAATIGTTTTDALTGIVTGIVKSLTDSTRAFEEGVDTRLAEATKEASATRQELLATVDEAVTAADDKLKSTVTDITSAADAAAKAAAATFADMQVRPPPCPGAMPRTMSWRRTRKDVPIARAQAQAGLPHGDHFTSINMIWGRKPLPGRHRHPARSGRTGASEGGGRCESPGGEPGQYGGQQGRRRRCRREGTHRRRVGGRGEETHRPPGWHQQARECGGSNRANQSKFGCVTVPFIFATLQANPLPDMLSRCWGRGGGVWHCIGGLCLLRDGMGKVPEMPRL